MAENVPFARTMLHGLMGRLQARFTPRANATSKADIWRLAAVDPLMVSHRGGPRGSLGAQSRSPDASALVSADPVHHSPPHPEDGYGRQGPGPLPRPHLHPPAAAQRQPGARGCVARPQDVETRPHGDPARGDQSAEVLSRAGVGGYGGQSRGPELDAASGKSRIPRVTSTKRPRCPLLMGRSFRKQIPQPSLTRVRHGVVFAVRGPTLPRDRP